LNYSMADKDDPQLTDQIAPEVEQLMGSKITSNSKPDVAFASLNLHANILKATADLGFNHCTPIQAQTLPHTLTGTDIVGQAQTGTGKTAAFLITILQRILMNPLPPDQQYSSEPRALVVAPTRELALQIEKDANLLAKYVPVNVISVIGGTQLERKRQQLRDQQIDLLIATPGRLLDHFVHKDIFLDAVEVLVLDEADRMLDMGFIPDVKRIVNATPRGRQTLLFSATFSEDILNLSRRWTTNPVEIILVSDVKPADTVDQLVYMVEHSAKKKLLVNLLNNTAASRVIIFCNRRDETRQLCEYLNRRGIRSEMISGELPQHKRVRTLEKFRSGDFQALVATDVAGRGIHIDDVSHVVNYNLPEDPEDYVHRIGRTGRAGALGTSVSFACEDDSFLIPELEKYLGQELTLLHPEPELLK
jgi:ATP-dependent RNA helicase RhlB